MTYELFYYIVLVLVGCVFCISSISSERTYFFLTLFLFFFYSIITRYSGFDIDINTYASALKSEVFSIYFLKEPVYWITSRYIYKITGSPELTFMVYDFISFVLVLKARKNMSLPQYFPYLFLLFFPSVMGINNVYRQYLAYSIFIYFTSLLFVNSSFSKKAFFILMSVLMHNVSALFSPLFFAINNKKSISIKSLILYISVIVMLPFALGTKSNNDTGDLGVEIYILVMITLFVFYVFSYRFVFNDVAAKFFYYFLFLISLTSFSTFLMGSAQSKRVGMYSLMIMLVPIVKSIEDNYSNKKLLRLIVFVVLILPTLLFSSSLGMLLT